jgi:membrane-bound lytic murein transglycosylase B
MFKPLIYLALLFPQIHAAVSLEAKENRMVQNMITDVNKKYNIPKDWLAQQFVSLKMNERVLNLMQRPFESKPWHHYKKMMLSERRIENGKRFMQQHKNVLQKYENQYQVPATVVTSIIGIETSYGANKGDFHVLEALATLSFYYTPRSEFFYNETVSLLRYAFKNNVLLTKIKSSYAGAIGIPQFMPSNIDKYAVAHERPGHIDIYNNTTDAIASVFNYLKKSGKWQHGQPIMRKLVLSGEKTKQLSAELASKRMLEVTPTVVERYNLRPGSRSWLIRLETADGNWEYYRVFQNFKAIMRYNNSIHYSSAVYQLSQRLTDSAR